MIVQVTAGWVRTQASTTRAALTWPGLAEQRLGLSDRIDVSRVDEIDVGIECRIDDALCLIEVETADDIERWCRRSATQRHCTETYPRNKEVRSSCRYSMTSPTTFAD
jgi:hypothetical protein